MIWSLLGIQPTKDKKEITSAYRAQLLHSNPEDDPEKFKQLRSAYEEALKLADKSEEVINHSTVDIWKQKLSDLYNNFPRRINAENWIALLNEDVCVALDTRPLIEEILLRFLMEDYFIPQSVWQTLDHVFHWLERKEELYETYPKDFIDFAVINGICYPENLPSELFIPGLNGKDCDIVISMGCNVTCPYMGKEFDDNWQLEDPTGKSEEEFMMIIHEIEKKISKLKEDLQ